MKRVISLLVIVLLFSNCDDGDLTLETINFDDITTIQNCNANNILYKLREKESLLLDIPKTAFINNPTPVGEPILIDIDNADYRVIYRFYNGTVSSENICNSIPPATPAVTDQWTGISGKIQITTTTTTSKSTTDNITRITGYNHNITFKNITFERASGNQVYETFPFGDYTTTPEFNTPLVFDQVIEQCETSKQIYNYGETEAEALTIDNIDPTLIVNTETPLNTPRTGYIGATQNKLTYRTYKNTLDASYFCNATTPPTPGINEEWNGVNGLGTSGVIEVTTIKNGNTSYKHTIVIKNASLKKGNNIINLGENYIYGVLTLIN